MKPVKGRLEIALRIEKGQVQNDETVAAIAHKIFRGVHDRMMFDTSKHATWHKICKGVGGDYYNHPGFVLGSASADLEKRALIDKDSWALFGLANIAGDFDSKDLDAIADAFWQQEDDVTLYVGKMLWAQWHDMDVDQHGNAIVASLSWHGFSDPRHLPTFTTLFSNSSAASAAASSSLSSLSSSSSSSSVVGGDTPLDPRD